MKKQFKSHLRLAFRNFRTAMKILFQIVITYFKGNSYNVKHQNRMYEEKRLKQMIDNI